MRIALFGTDSDKKRYAALFSASKSTQHKHFRFEIYGHDNNYYKSLKLQFPDLNIILVKSSEVEVSTFLQTIDAVVSVAEHEGFGRLIALSLSAGIKCFLLESPVFEEFFSRSTQLHKNIPELVESLRRCKPSDGTSGCFEEQLEISRSFQTAREHLLGLATSEGWMV